VIFEDKHYSKMGHFIPRLSNGSDKYRNGEIIPPDHFVIVPKFRCASVEIDGDTKYDPSKGSSLFLLTHVSPNLIIGNSRIKNKEDKILDTGELVHGYIVTTYYLVIEGIVYSRKGYEEITKEGIKRIISLRGISPEQYADRLSISNESDDNE
jgi:hypothetical protein